MTVTRIAPLSPPPAEAGLATGAALSWLDGLHLGSDLLIGLSYVAISATLVYLFQRAKGGIPFSGVVLAFAAFIIGCGATHFMHIALALNPDAWWGLALAQAVTLAASAATAVMLPPLVPRILALVEAARLSEARQRQLEANHAELEGLYTRLKERSEVRARRLIEANVIGVIVARADGTIHEANDAFLRLLGYGRDDLMAGRLVWSALTPPEDAPRDARALDELRATGAAVPWEKEYLCRDGSRVPVVVGAARVPADDEKEDEYVAFVLDLTTQRRAEAERAALLEREQAARAMAEAASRAKDEFLSTAAHELKTPITAVRGFVEMLARWTPEQRAAREAQTLVVLLRQCDRLNQLVQNLLEVSRLAVDQLALRRQTVELGALARAVVEEMEGVANGHRLSLEAPAPAWVIGDRDRLDQVLVNLLSNAIKFSPEGSAVTVRVGQEGEGAVLSVEDHGVGIPAAQQGQIFERFYRAHAATEHDYGGMGIGLHFSRELVERHGGRMWFESVEGAGSTFYMSLPLAAPTGEENGHGGERRVVGSLGG